jgi:hypothetical protein
VAIVALGLDRPLVVQYGVFLGVPIGMLAGYRANTPSIA